MASIVRVNDIMISICMIAYTTYMTDSRPKREAETLARRGDSIDFIALSEYPRPSIETINGVRLIRLRQSKYRGDKGLRYIMAYICFIFRASVKLCTLFLERRYEIIYLHTMPDFIAILGILPRLFGAKVILNIHDMMPELYMSKFDVTTKHPLIRLLIFQEKLSIKLSHKVICVHHPHHDVLVKRNAPPEKLTIIPNLPDPNVFVVRAQPAKINTSFRIVYHGTIAKRLGLDLAILAFAEAAPRCPEARFEIYGDGDQRGLLLKMIEELGLKEKVYFSAKAFPVEQIANIIQGAAVGLIPNRKDVCTEYMLPVKLLEYVYLGIPCIVPRLYTIQYYFNSNQVAYFEPGNISDLASTICRIYSDSDYRLGLAINAQMFTQRFSWDSFKTNLYKVVDSW